MSSKSKVYFFFETQIPALRNRRELKRFIESIFKKERITLGSLNYVFCSDKKLLEINRKFLSHDYYTDVISFNLAESGPVEGEIYISSDRVRENAKSLGQPLRSEIQRVIFHGALHLCGYDDKTTQERLKMRKKEDHYLLTYSKLVPRKTVSA